MPKVWVACTFLVLILASCTTAPSMLIQQSQQASSIATLAWWMFTVSAIIFLVVVALLLVALLKHRRKDLTTPLKVNDRRSLVWVLIGGLVAPLVVLTLALALSVSISKAEDKQPPANALVVEVIAHRWWWEVFYPNSSLVTANEIHIPVGQPVNFKLTSADVIHSFWVPQLHGKIDMIPGQTNSVTLQVDQAGSYHGECAEFCGIEHAKMDLVVVAEPLDQYNTWLAQQAEAAADPPPASMEKKDQQTFLGSACVYCHTVRGTNASGTVGPDLTHLASRSTIGAGILPNTPTNLAGWVTDSQSIKPGNLMPPMDLDPYSVQQILSYLATLK